MYLNLLHIYEQRITYLCIQNVLLNLDLDPCFELDGNVNIVVTNCPNLTCNMNVSILVDEKCWNSVSRIATILPSGCESQNLRPYL